ncbi:MAG: c-type cytochrome [Thiotrichaceae bacterium]
MTKFTKISTSIAATLLMAVSGSAMADGAALYTAKGCAACHGADAKSPIMPAYPAIAGQSNEYLTQQMTDIKTGDRSNGQSGVMKGVMAAVSDAEIAEMATYISGLK